MLEYKIRLLHPSFCGCIFFRFLVSLVASEKIPLGSGFSPIENHHWVSPNGNFAFGFFNSSDQPNHYSAGVRFNSGSIPVHEQRVVWIAGEDVTVSSESFLHLTVDGDLVLFDLSKGFNAWTSNTSHLNVLEAALLDNGNLVLLNRSGSIVWESFQNPTDTLLPGQDLTISQTLRAASINSISSYYSLLMDTTGQLKLRWETNVSYWNSGTSSLAKNLPIGATFTKDGALQLFNQRMAPVWSRFSEDYNDSSVGFRFLRLDVDGNLRMYSWIEVTQSWRSVWQAVSNQCEVFATCGLHGVCVFNPTGSTDCRCPFQFSTDSNCLAPYKSCSSAPTMITLENTALQGIYPPEELITYSSLEQCKNSCLIDPRCTSVTVTNDGSGQCRTKQTRFISGYQHPSLMSVSFVKICLDPEAGWIGKLPAEAPSSSPLIERNHGFCKPCLIGAVCGTFVAFFIIQITIGLCFFKRRIRGEEQNQLQTGMVAFMDPNSRGLIRLSYAEIKDLTRDLKHKLGPKVFKGVLPNNQHVAIKEIFQAGESGGLRGGGRRGEEKQFRSAVFVLGSIHHKNLNRLEGYCCEFQHRYLIYEFAKNGSVEKWIDEGKLSKKLTWRKRMEICLGVARAVAYLHSECREFVSHGNLKLENVVLDEEMVPKVTEFGLGRLSGYRACTSSAAAACGAAETDVLRFGEMVVEMVSGRRGGMEICRWAYRAWVEEGRVDGVVDARIQGGVDKDEVERVLRIAFWCVQEKETTRPSMGEVVKVLDGTLPVDPPPSPFDFRRIQTEDDIVIPI